jgi:hypothetical protein
MPIYISRGRFARSARVRSVCDHAGAYCDGGSPSNKRSYLPRSGIFSCGPQATEEQSPAPSLRFGVSLCKSGESGGRVPNKVL